MKVQWFSHLRQKFITASGLAILLFVLVVGVALALTLANADGIWVNARSTGGGTPTCLNYNNTADITDENQVRYGNAPGTGCGPVSSRSGFGFNGSDSLVFNPGDVFLIGEFTHYNNPITANTRLELVDLAVTLDFSDPLFSTTFTYTVQLDETPNSAPCAYPGTTTCPDKVDFSSTIPDQDFTVDGKKYTLQIVGFAPGTASTCEYVEGQTINQFITEESQANYACLFGRIIEAPTSQITIIKDSDPDHYRDFQFDTSSTSFTSLDPTFFLDDDEFCDDGLGHCDGNKALLSNTKVFSDLLPGTYTITETYDVNLSWLTSPVICTAVQASTGGAIEPFTGYTWTPAPANKGGALAIALEEDQNVTCTFPNFASNPTSVTLASLGAQSGSTNLPGLLLAGFAGLAALVGGLFLFRTRRRTTANG